MSNELTHVGTHSDIFWLFRQVLAKGAVVNALNFVPRQVVVPFLDVFLSLIKFALRIVAVALRGGRERIKPKSRSKKADEIRYCVDSCTVYGMNME